jgi:hypothetical protein
MVRAAIARGADIEVLSGSASEELDSRAGGVAARLRFPLDRSPAATAAPILESLTGRS